MEISFYIKKRHPTSFTDFEGIASKIFVKGDFGGEYKLNQNRWHLIEEF